MCRSFRSLFSNNQGLALIEFTFIAPLLLVLVFGVVELTRFIIIVQKVERTAYSLSNVVGQYLPAGTAGAATANMISVTNINNDVFPQLRRVLDPYNATADFRAMITSVRKAGAGPNPIRISWQIAGGGTLSNADTLSIVNGVNPPSNVKSAVGATAIFNAEIMGYLATMQNQENMIVVEVFYNYRPLLSLFLSGLGASSLAQKTLISRVYTLPRQGDLITLP